MLVLMTRVRTAGAPALPFGPDPVQVLQGIPDDFNWLVLHEKPQVNDLGLWCRFFQHNARLKVRATSGRSGSEVLVELIHTPTDSLQVQFFNPLSLCIGEAGKKGVNGNSSFALA